MNKVDAKSIILSTLIGGGALWLIFGRKSTNALTASTFSNEAEQSAPTMPASYSYANFLALADKLETSMFDVGTDEDSIYNVFKVLKNNTDFALLFKAFGKRPYYTFGYNEGNWNLIQWLQEELSGSEQQTVNNILASKGITYRI